MGLVTPLFRTAWSLCNPNLTSPICDISYAFADGLVLVKGRPAGKTAVYENGFIGLHQSLDPRQTRQIASEDNVGGAESCIEAGHVVQCRVADDVPVRADADSGLIRRLHGGFNARRCIGGDPAHEGNTPFCLNVLGCRWQLQSLGPQIMLNPLDFGKLIQGNSRFRHVRKGKQGVSIAPPASMV